jgi:hypothetical protein
MWGKDVPESARLSPQNCTDPPNAPLALNGYESPAAERLSPTEVLRRGSGEAPARLRRGPQDGLVKDWQNTP